MLKEEVDSLREEVKNLKMVVDRLLDLNKKIVSIVEQLNNIDDENDFLYIM